MSEMLYRRLNAQEIDTAHQLSLDNPDAFSGSAVERFPRFYELANLIEPESVARDRHQAMLGAFLDDRMVGAVFVSIADNSVREIDWEPIQREFTDQEINAYMAISQDWEHRLIRAPHGSLYINMLCVSRAHRKRGIGARLLQEAVKSTDPRERPNLYIEVARRQPHIAMCKAAGFEIIRQRLSLFDRLQFKCWGSTLLRYRSDH